MTTHPTAASGNAMPKPKLTLTEAYDLLQRSIRLNEAAFMAAGNLTDIDSRDALQTLIMVIADDLGDTAAIFQTVAYPASPS